MWHAGQALYVPEGEVREMVAGAARALSTATWTQVVAAGHARPMVDLIGETAADALVRWLETAGVASQGMHVPEVASELVRLCKAWTPAHTPVPPTYASTPRSQSPFLDE